MFKIKLIFLLISGVIFTGVSSGQSYTDSFQRILDSVYKAQPGAIGIMVHVEAPDKDISWTTALGFSDRDSTDKLHKEQPVLIASNTKTYVAAAILKLVEQKQLRLDQSISGLLTLKTDELLQNAGYKPDKITIRNLLSHTSGIRDYVDEMYFEFVRTDPQHNWTRDQQIELATKRKKNVVQPGDEFSYGDINYLLLTEIIEQKTKEPFYTALRILLNYEKTGLKNTWFINLEQPPSARFPLAHQYFDKYDWDSYELNPSWDLYGGGGLASTVEDAALFYQALFEGEIIEDPALLEEMYSYVLPKEESNYCLGIRHIPFDEYRIYYHGGFWGTDVLYSPDTNASVAVFTLSKDKREAINPFLGKKITEILLKKD